jgi:N-methylhydantoinase B/oxoprolinase/acetone carboxylase alpha subunit
LFYINRFQNDIDIKIKEQFVMFCEKLVENPFIRNKTLNNLYHNLLQTTKVNSNDLRNNENYFQEFINELKVQIGENQKGNLDIVSLIKKHDSNVFKQKKLFDIYK